MNLEAFFPHAMFRTGQKELATSVYDACTRGNRLVAEAMNGFGKTAAVLSGTLLAADENQLRIIYLCRTKRQVSRVTEEISAIQKKTPVRSAHLFSKFDYCLLKQLHPYITSESFKWFCSFNVTNNLCSYFLNVSFLPKEMADLVHTSSNNLLSHQTLLEKGQRFHLCPYEVTRISIPDARIITTTYHYLFEEASKSVLFTNTQLDPHRTILVVDEAHNLRDFIRGITTFGISFNQLQQSAEDSRTLFFGKVSTSLRLLTQRAQNFCSKHDGWRLDKAAFVSYLRENEHETWLSNLALELTACANAAWHSISSGVSPPLSALRVGKFLTNLLASVKDESSILTKSASGLTIVNADPGKTFLTFTKNFRSVILLSATINPLEVFLKSLGLENASVEVHTAKSIESLQIRTILDLGVTTKYKSRTADMYEKIAQKIIAVMQSSKGGIGIFVPSYSVLEALKILIERNTGSRPILVETKGITNEKASELMSNFKSTPRSILLAVQGGRFSEGEDFRDEQMDISIVVGLALPPPSPLMYAEYTFLAKTDQKSSYLIISLLPALRRAFQSAGRHVRSPNKRGLVLLFDSRFSSKTVLELMPKWLRRDLVMGDFSPATLSEMIRDFETMNN